METKKVPLSEAAAASPAMTSRVAMRTKSADAWIEDHASGTLRKNKRIGFKWKSQYLHERICYEFGWLFESMPASYVTFNDPITEGDCHAITEAGWHIERGLTMWPFPEDVFETKYIEVSDDKEATKKRAGVGVIVKQTSAPFVPESHLVFALIADWDPVAKDWINHGNPW